MEDRLKWLRGPLPPLSESMVESGLVPESYAHPHTHIQQAVFSTSKTPPKNTKKKKIYQNHHIENPKQTSQKNEIQFDIPSDSNSQVEISKQYRPPPIETFASAPINKSHEKLMSFEPKIRLRDQVAELNDTLTQKMKEIENQFPDINLLESSQIIDLRQQMVLIHNFIFNKLILLEKSNCSDRALLLRRLLKFYNDVITDLPQIVQTFQNEQKSHEAAIETMKTQMDDLNLEMKHKDEIIDEEKKLKTNLESKIQDLLSKISEKDINLEAIQNELNLLKARFNKLQFENNKNLDEIENLKQINNKNIEENHQLISQIEKMYAEIHDLQSGDAGYISQYRAEVHKTEILEEKVKELELVINDFKNIPKQDKLTDTSDLNTKTKKKKNRLSNETSEISTSLSTQNSYYSTNSSQHLSGTSSFLNQNPSFVTQGSPLLDLNLSFINRNSSITHFDVRPDAITQTEVSLFEQNENSKEVKSNNFECSKIDQSIQVDITDNEFHQISNQQDNLDDKQSNEYENLYDIPTEFEEQIKSLPNMSSVTLNLMIYPKTEAKPVELKEFNLGLLSGKAQPNKPLSWGLQLIHNFLSDPSINSSFNSEKLSMEIIFKEWIAKTYGIPSLINQIVTDMSYLLAYYHNENGLITLFQELLESRYSFTQVCFMSNLYIFSVQFTSPSILSLLQKGETNNDIMISKGCAFSVLSKLLTPDVANDFIRSRSNPLVFTDFLRQATVFFGDRHQKVWEQAKSLLSICGGSGLSISFNEFERFFAVLDPEFDARSEWKSLKQNNLKDIQPSFENHEDELNNEKKTNSDPNFITFTELFGCFIHNRNSFINLIQADKLLMGFQIIKTSSSYTSKIIVHFIERIIHLVPKVIEKISIYVNKAVTKEQSELNEIKNKAEKRIDLIRKNILAGDIPQLLWNYRMFLNLVEDYGLKNKGCIPYNSQASKEVFDQLLNYFDETEKCSFALIF